MGEDASDDGTDGGFVWETGTHGFEFPHEAEVFLFLEEGTGIGFEVGCDDDFAKDFADGAGEGLGEGSVRDDDAAERGLFIGIERLVPSEAEIVIASDSTRVCVFEDGDGGGIELFNEL